MKTDFSLVVSSVTSAQREYIPEVLHLHLKPTIYHREMFVLLRHLDISLLPVKR